MRPACRTTFIGCGSRAIAATSRTTAPTSWRAAEGDLAADLHHPRRNALDHAVDRRPVALAAGRHAVDAPFHDPQRALLGDRNVAGLGALDLGVAAPYDLDRAGEKLRLGVRV